MANTSHTIEESDKDLGNGVFLRYSYDKKGKPDGVFIIHPERPFDDGRTHGGKLTFTTAKKTDRTTWTWNGDIDKPTLEEPFICGCLFNGRLVDGEWLAL